MSDKKIGRCDVTFDGLKSIYFRIAREFRVGTFDVEGDFRIKSITAEMCPASNIASLLISMEDGRKFSMPVMMDATEQNREGPDLFGDAIIRELKGAIYGHPGE